MLTAKMLQNMARINVRSHEAWAFMPIKDFQSQSGIPRNWAENDENYVARIQTVVDKLWNRELTTPKGCYFIFACVGTDIYWSLRLENGKPVVAERV